MDEDDFGGNASNAGTSSSINGTDDDLSLPKATVTKMVQELLPPDVFISKDSLNLIIDCCIEFIHLVAAESNEICEKESKKTIVPEHIQSALTNLGFTDYLEEVEAVLQEVKQSAKTKEKKATKFEESGLSEEELQKQQEELFQKARQRYQEQHQEETEETPLTVNSTE
jgi:histone H3/H4